MGLRGYGCLLMVLPCILSIQNYQLEVVLISYENPTNQLRFGGHCCTPRNRAPCDNQGGLEVCTAACDPYFVINSSAVNSSTNYTTPVYNNISMVYLNSDTYIFYGSDTTWPGNSINVTVAIYDHNVRLTNPNDDIIMDYFEFTIHTQETDCVFHNMSMRHSTLHCRDGYVELNISYRLTSACAAFPLCPVTNTSHPIPVIDVNLCSDLNLCGDNGQCQRTEVGGYRCECTEGYSGTHCEQIDLCVVYSPCRNGGNCSHTMVSTSFELGKEIPWYTCSCPDNWTGLNCDVYMIPTPTTTRVVEMMCSSQSQPLPSSSVEVPHCSNPPSHVIIETVQYKTNIPKASSSPALYGVTAVMGFMAGLLLAGLGVITVICFRKMRARKKTSPKRQRNPFYQSVEDLTENTGTKDPMKHVYNNVNVSEDNDEYATLKAVPPPHLCGTGKLIARTKKLNKYRYCLSPTDPPVPLRPVPRARSPQYEKVNLQAPKRPKILPLDHSAKPTGKSVANSSDSNTKMLQRRNSPIYEMVELSHRDMCPQSSVQPAQPPTLPMRGHRHRATTKVSSIATESMCHPPQSVTTQSASLHSQEGTATTHSHLLKDSGTTSGGEQRVEDEGEKVAKKEDTENMSEDEKGATPDKLYSTVKKVKAYSSIIKKQRMLESEDVCQYDEQRMPSPYIIPVKKTQSLLVEDDREVVELQAMSSHSQPNTSFII